MAVYGLHWSERKPDPNVRRSADSGLHTNQVRMSSETLVKLLTLRAKLLGKKLNIAQEAEEFAAQNLA